MYYAAMRKYDIANGIGIRTSLFVSGCTRNCPGCFNTLYQNFKYGTPWDKASLKQFLEYMEDPMVQGATLLGGEPMDQIHDNDLYNLLQVLKTQSTKSIWMYSGYTFEEIIKDPKKKALLKYVDVLVDGPFIEAQKDIRLRFRGSHNQRILDVAASLDNKKPTWYQLKE